MNEGTKAVDGRGEKVTIYFRSSDSFMGNVHKIEARLHAYGRRRYAQYESAAFAVFTPKGGRTKKGVTATYRPYLLVLKGWNRWPEPPSPWTAPAKEGGVVVTKSKHLSCSDAWVTDFEAVLGAVDADDVVVDFRGVNPHEKKFNI